MYVKKKRKMFSIAEINRGYTDSRNFSINPVHIELNYLNLKVNLNQ